MTDMNDLKEGIIIKSNRWREPVKIDKIKESHGFIELVGSTIHSNEHINSYIPISELDDITIDKIETNFSSDPQIVFLAFEAIRYKYASLYDPLLAVNISKIHPLPHQIEAVYGYVLKLPRIRFLIADDPGAGKTIMAGLILKELKIRNVVDRILIVVPGHLKDQWRRELKERFEEYFVVVDRSYQDAHYGENVWQKENQIITSIDFAKQDDIVQAISSVNFDITIVDEAHKMSAYKYGDQVTKTQRYKFGERISEISENLLFLTATPHKGDPENFRLFLDLLEPGFFATNEMLQESIRNKENPLFIRRIKEDLKDFDGKPLFLDRHVRTLKFELSNEEKKLYNEVSRYVQDHYNKALTKDKRRNIGFALVILQRRLASSTFSLLKSLQRRLEKLENYESLAEDAQTIGVRAPSDYDEFEDLSEEDRWREEEIWETLSVAENRQELRKEINIIENLIEMAKDIVNNENEVKLKELNKTLHKLDEEHQGSKIIIFTEAKDTLEYLEKRITNWGYSVTTIHGGMKLDQRIQAEAIFKNKKQVLVATEAAGEGINLQFCHLMINYDIPWNPNRLEQRMGRIHRYGQQKEVYIFNLVAKKTREGEVLIRLFEKLDEIRSHLGSDKVFDIIGDIFPGRNLQQLLIEAASSAKTMDELLGEIDITIDDDYISKIKENLGESLATRYIDYTHIKEMNDKAREYKLIPEYTEEFFKMGYNVIEGRYRERKDGFLAVENVPFELRQVAERTEFRTKHGGIINRYPKSTFDKDIAFKNQDAEFLSFGHPLFEALLKYITETYSEDLKIGAVFQDPEGKLDGYILIYEGEVRDGLNNTVGKKIFTIYTNEEETKAIPSTVLWDLGFKQESDGSVANVDQLKEVCAEHVIREMSNYTKEKREERRKEARIKEKYGVKSLEYHIVKLDKDLIQLYQRKESGENVDIVIRNKKSTKKRYEIALVDLKDKIERERTLTMNIPKFTGIIRVKPIKTVSPFMKRDDEIERIGMEEAMKYEIENNRTPEDVSSENLGYDIRSTDEEGNKRYIEVKARAGFDGIVMTKNEWFKAQRFKSEFYLYVVLNASKEPILKVIEDPFSKLKPEELFEIVRYFVPVEQLEEAKQNEQ